MAYLKSKKFMAPMSYETDLWKNFSKSRYENGEEAEVVGDKTLSKVPSTNQSIGDSVIKGHSEIKPKSIVGEAVNKIHDTIETATWRQKKLKKKIESQLIKFSSQKKNNPK